MNDLSVLSRSLLADCRPRARSLMVTIVGDGLATHGGAAWLSSLIRLGTVLDMNERLVRTSVLRLVRDQWLTSELHGRRSVYRLSRIGWQRVEEARHRFYSLSRPPWDGHWRLILVVSRDKTQQARGKLRRELLWLGFGALAPNLFAHPTVEFDEVRPIVEHLALAEAVVPMVGDTLPGAADANTAFATAWDLGSIGADYRRFVDRFTLLHEALERGAAPDPETAFIIRMLVMHEYRRVMLRDPSLPDELMPEGWAGLLAREMCARIYRAVAPASTAYLLDTLERPEGPVDQPDASYYLRFGGLPRPDDAGAEPRREAG